jgi:hypothetical protein
VRLFCHFSRQRGDGKPANSAFCSTASAICEFILRCLSQAEPVKTIKTAMSNVSWSTMSTHSRSNTNSASTSSSGGVPPISNPIGGRPIKGGAPLGPIAAFEKSAAILSQCAVQAEHAAREAAADAQEMKNAHATIVSQHQKMFLQTAFGINPDGTPITDPSLCPDKLKKYNSVKSVEQYNDMIKISLPTGGTMPFLRTPHQMIQKKPQL